MAKRGVLIGVMGPNCKARNVLKIRPALVVTADQVDEVVTCLDDVLKAM